MLQCCCCVSLSLSIEYLYMSMSPLFCCLTKGTYRYNNIENVKFAWKSPMTLFTLISTSASTSTSLSSSPAIERMSIMIYIICSICCASTWNHTIQNTCYYIAPWLSFMSVAGVEPCVCSNWWELYVLSKNLHKIFGRFYWFHPSLLPPPHPASLFHSFLFFVFRHWSMENLFIWYSTFSPSIKIHVRSMI